MNAIARQLLPLFALLAGRSFQYSRAHFALAAAYLSIGPLFSLARSLFVELCKRAPTRRPQSLAATRSAGRLFVSILAKAGERKLLAQSNGGAIFVPCAPRKVALGARPLCSSLADSLDFHWPTPTCCWVFPPTSSTYLSASPPGQWRARV